MIVILLLALSIGAVSFWFNHTETGRKLWNLGMQARIRSGGNIKKARRMIRFAMFSQGYGAQLGIVSIDALIMGMVAILILFTAVIPNISNSNTAVQGSANASAMTKTWSGIGEWLFPAAAIIGICLIFLRHQTSGGKSKKGT